MKKRKEPIKGKALKRALKTKDNHRVYDDIPLIYDETILITPKVAHEMLSKNDTNRPINFPKAREFAAKMKAGEWKFHSQGIIIDNNGNLLTGQKRLWAVIKSNTNQYFRVSKGSPPDTAEFIDRGVPQSSRDLASRKTERKHSLQEGSIVRGVLALEGNVKPSLDDIAAGMVAHAPTLEIIMEQTRRIKKTKSLYMVLAAICAVEKYRSLLPTLLGMSTEIADEFTADLAPTTPEQCWNRGAAFTLAMEKAASAVETRLVT